MAEDRDGGRFRPDDPFDSHRYKRTPRIRNITRVQGFAEKPPPYGTVRASPALDTVSSIAARRSCPNLAPTRRRPLPPELSPQLPFGSNRV
ncbi:hypothetical protein NL676_006536 [Syzygium grande]|nr:hypothetical protein NL676_006536 [Syzygium grande]